MPEEQLPARKSLHHVPPSFVASGEIFFLTICVDPRGSQAVVEPATAAVLLEAARYYHDTQRWWLGLMVLMPDHLHALVSFPALEVLSQVVGDWKRYTARKTRLHWQKNFFDHRLRGDEGLDQKWRYIRENPVRAELCATPDEWPWWTETR